MTAKLPKSTVFLVLREAAAHRIRSWNRFFAEAGKIDLQDV